MVAAVVAEFERRSVTATRILSSTAVFNVIATAMTVHYASSDPAASLGTVAGWQRHWLAARPPNLRA